MQEDIRNVVVQHNKDKDLIIKEEITIKKGKNKILISAPHSFKHVRNGKDKVRDYLTWSLVRIICHLSNCHAIYINQDIDYDPNYDKDNNYYNTLKSYVKKHNIEYVIDLHTFADKEQSDLDIGVNDYKNVNYDKDLIANIVKTFNKHDLGEVTVDQVYKSKTNTISNRINKDLKVKALQLEIGELYRNTENEEANSSKIINALLDVVGLIEKFNLKCKIKQSKKNIDKKDKLKVINSKVDFINKFDKTLDIKPAWGYKRELPEVIPYNYVGLEIEVSVNFMRDKYSFTKTCLEKIKDAVGTKGYFVKDNTIIGNYGFEIVLDPLSTEDIYEILTTLNEIIKFSKGIIEVSSAKNCGIHLNFNKYDVTNIKEAHKRLTAYLSEKDNYFEENIYKQFKFIWSYDDYFDYQRKVSSKYVWANYLGDKVIEIRNIKTSLNPTEIVVLITKILDALYYDKETEKFDNQTYISLDKIYDTALDKVKKDEVFEKINNHGFVVIGLKENIPNILSLNDKLVEEIKNGYLNINTDLWIIYSKVVYDFKTKDNSINRIKEYYYKKYNSNIGVYADDAFSIICSSEGNKVYYEGKEITKFPKAIYFRKYDIYLARQFESLGIKVINSSYAMENARNKMKTYQILSDNYINVPKSLYFSSGINRRSYTYSDITKVIKNKQFVLKPSFGSKGEGIHLINNEVEYNKIIKDYKGICIFQEYIKSESDYRVYILGNKFIKAIKRTNDKDFRKNLALGATRAIINDPDYELINISEKVAAVMNLWACTIDFLYQDGKYYVCEVNTISGHSNVPEIKSQKYLLDLLYDEIHL